jgi:protein-S-isoprenylcysteine O-methyltransferase Ste14
MAASLKNECKRWAWQLLIAVCSPVYFLLIFEIVMGSRQKYTDDAKNIFIAIFICIYYFLSFYIHQIYDSKIILDKLNKKPSIRKLLLLSLSFLFITSIYLFNFGEHYHFFMFKGFTPFILFLITSIIFTWWFSELVVRWRQRRNAPN